MRESKGTLLKFLNFPYLKKKITEKEERAKGEKVNYISRMILKKMSLLLKIAIKLFNMPKVIVNYRLSL